MGILKETWFSELVQTNGLTEKVRSFDSIKIVQPISIENYATIG